MSINANGHYHNEGRPPLSVSSETAVPALSARAGRRSRRSWSDEQKRRIVAEAFAPGASVAEVARRHGVNANLVFSWHRLARPEPVVVDAVSGSEVAPTPEDASRATECDFIPIGVLSRAADGGPALCAEAPRVPRGPAASDPAPVDARAGLIEVDLADGTRLRVDAFVNERALRRVLAALKATL